MAASFKYCGMKIVWMSSFSPIRPVGRGHCDIIARLCRAGIAFCDGIIALGHFPATLENPTSSTRLFRLIGQLFFYKIPFSKPRKNRTLSTMKRSFRTRPRQVERVTTPAARLTVAIIASAAMGRTIRNL